MELTNCLDPSDCPTLWFDNLSDIEANRSQWRACIHPIISTIYKCPINNTTLSTTALYIDP